MSNLVFPSLAGVTLEVVRPDQFSTAVLTSRSGQEFRAMFYSRPKARYRFTFEFLRSGSAFLEWQKLKGFYQRLMGRFDSFLLTDPDDSSVTTMKFGLGDGTTTAFQLQKTFVANADLSSPVQFWPKVGDGFEPIQALNGAASIYVDGVLKTIVTDYTISADGVVTFVSAPALSKSLTWSGAYYKRCRFDTDLMETERMVVDIWSARSVELVQVFG